MTDEPRETPNPDPLPPLLAQRTALIAQFANDLQAIDTEIGVAQRHNVQVTIGLRGMTARNTEPMSSDSENRMIAEMSSRSTKETRARPRSRSRCSPSASRT